MTLLDIITVIVEKVREINEGSIKTFIDYQEIFWIIKGMKIVNYHAQDASAEVTKIKQLLTKTNIRFEFELQQGYESLSRLWNEDSGPYMIAIYHHKANRVREFTKAYCKTKIKHYRAYIIISNGIQQSKAIKEILQIKDVQAEEKAIYQNKV